MSKHHCTTCACARNFKCSHSCRSAGRFTQQTKAGGAGCHPVTDATLLISFEHQHHLPALGWIWMAILASKPNQAYFQVPTFTTWLPRHWGIFCSTNSPNKRIVGLVSQPTSCLTQTLFIWKLCFLRCFLRMSDVCFLMTYISAAFLSASTWYAEAMRRVKEWLLKETTLRSRSAWAQTLYRLF